MSIWEYYDEPIDIPREERRPRDPKTDEAKARLVKLFEENPERVFFGRQIEVLLEKDFFHWITSRALAELVAERKIKSEKVALRTGIDVRFCTAKGNRYWKRQAKKVGDLILDYSDHEFTRALGRHGELMFDAALPTVGFMPKAKDVREYGGKKWEETEHNLDRVFECEGVPYGAEVKNTLDYIPVEELAVKLKMCAALELKPLFIMRWAPKNYMKRIIDAGASAWSSSTNCTPSGMKRWPRGCGTNLG